MIDINNLSKKYGNKQVLNNINLSFKKGKVYGIVGKNGAGKTTLFKCLAGLEKYEGTITSEYKTLKNNLGLLFAEPYFFPKTTGKEYIQLFLNARNINNVNIETKNIFELPLNIYIEKYSTGMKKKLAITAILLQNNNILILDEPFNGVDIHSNIIILEIIKKLKEKGKTILISSHIFSTLSSVCEEIYLLENGCITKKSTKEEFYKLEEKMIGFINKDIDKFIT